MSRHVRLTGLLLLALFTASGARGASVGYHNNRWDFQLSYPAGWSPNYGADGAGVLLLRGGRSMAVGALYANEDDQGRPSLFCSPMGIDPLVGTSGRHKVTGKRLLAQHRIRFQGYSACWYRLGYYVDDRPYEGDYFSLLRDGLQYDFTVECDIQSCGDVRRTYRTLLNTFRFGNDRN
jgi:hypothetical protein